MERLTDETQIGPFAALKDKAEAVPGAFGTYDCFYAHMVAVTRLKEYEDTGLEPEDIDVLQDRVDGLAELLVNISCGCTVSYDRLKELAQAEKDGRLVVLPCKVGDILFAAEDAPVIPVAVTDIGIVLDGPAGEDWESVGNIGKTVFLTREEAEAALKKREEAGAT